MIVHTLITAIALDNEDVELTKQCYNSFVNCKTSFINDIMVDTRLHPKDQALTGKWNDFINFYRNKDYDYLMICANDTIAHPDALEYMVRVMQDNLDVGIIHPVMNRDRENFNSTLNKYTGIPSMISKIVSDRDFVLPKNTDTYEYYLLEEYDNAYFEREINQNYINYTSELFFSPHETANMILRKGVIEKVGKFDLLFPHQYNERDYFVRAKKLGIKLATSPMKLFYHPPHSQDDPNRQVLSVAEQNFNRKHGANWEDAINGGGFEHPFNDSTLDWTHTK